MGYMDTTQKNRPLNRLVSLKLVYKLTPSQGLALDMLMERQLVTADDLVEEAVAPSTTTARTVLKRLRQATSDKFQIQNKYAVGYWITPEIKNKIMADLVAFNYPER